MNRHRPPTLRPLTASAWLEGWRFSGSGKPRFVDGPSTAEWTILVNAHSDAEWLELQSLPLRQRDIIYASLLVSIREIRKDTPNDTPR
jgi:hypothetical protein